MAALAAIRRTTPALIVLKLGPGGCVAFPGAISQNLEDGVLARGFPVEVFNVLGAGDAFMAGFLRGWLRDLPLARCCEYANACGAIVVSRHGCAPAMPTWPELEQFLAQTSRPFRQHQFEELAAELDVDPARIAKFKMLALEAVHQLAQGDPRFGVLIDGRHGAEALAKASDHPYWIGRPIELPKSRPLAFECSADVATELAEWPLRHVVKCLVIYHPDDEPGLRDAQEAQLHRLFDACRKTRHEFLLEIITPTGMPLDGMTVARAIRRFYDIGLKPDWWKLEPTGDAAAWRNIEAAIVENDPYCRGVVLLGLSAPEAELLASFEAAAPVRIVKGFAVGRTIFNDAARDWLSGRIDDQAAIRRLADKLSVLTEAWRRARGAVEAAA